MGMAGCGLWAVRRWHARRAAAGPGISGRATRTYVSKVGPGQWCAWRAVAEAPAEAPAYAQPLACMEGNYRRTGWGICGAVTGGQGGGMHGRRAGIGVPRG